MRIVIIETNRDFEEATLGLTRTCGAEVERVGAGDALARTETLADAAAIVVAVSASEEERLLRRIHDLAPGPVRILVRAASSPGALEEALRRGADEILFAETLRSPEAGARELCRAIETGRARRTLRNERLGEHGEDTELLRVVFDNDLAAISLNELGGRYVAVNDAWLAETGYRREEVIGRTPTDLRLWTDPGQVRALVRDVRAKGTAQLDEVRVRVKDGREKLYRIGLALAEHRGRPHVVSFARDVTEERRLAREFLQAQKMEAVGRLAAGVAHDFNNLLTVVQMATYFARRSHADPVSLDDCLEEIEQTGRRGATLVRQLLAFARREDAKPRVIDLDELVLDLEKLLRRVIGEDVELETRLGSSPATVFADPGQIEQILMNLAINARDAMPAGGRLTIETRAVELAAVPGDGTSLPGRYVGLMVRDTGGGISEEVRARLFEPFFTTKPIGEGTGLGLVSVDRIVRESGGRILVDSEPGKGAAFQVLLPRHEEKATGFEAGGDAEVRGGAEDVLVLEDENVLRARICAVLAAHGYRVREAADGAAALHHAVLEGRAPDLVISDVRMPHMSGPEAVGYLRERFGDLPALYLSGYLEPELERRDGTKGGGSRILRKPFTPEGLLRAVRGMLDRRSPGSKLTSPVEPRRESGDGCGAGGDPPRDRAPGARRRDRRETPDPGAVR